MTFNADLDYKGSDENHVVSLGANVVHEKLVGDTYFAALNTLSDDERIDSFAKWLTNNGMNAQDVELYFNATADYVKRGYVVVDWNLSGLVANTDVVHTMEMFLNNPYEEEPYKIEGNVLIWSTHL